MAKRTRTRRILLLLGGGLGAYLGMSYWSACRALTPDTPPVPVPAFVDATTLPKGNPIWQTHGLTAKKPSPTVFVFAHGYGGGLNQWEPVMADLKRLGYDSLEISSPGHGGNPDPVVGFGPKEAGLISEAVDFVRTQGAEKVVVVGVSMGGAAAWLATELNPHIDAIATESAFARFDEAMDHWTARGGIFMKPMIWFAAQRSGIDPATIVPLRAAEKWHKPALVLQAEMDQIIERSHADRLAKASGARLQIVPGVSHASCYAKLGTDYAMQLIDLSRQT